MIIKEGKKRSYRKKLLSRPLVINFKNIKAFNINFERAEAVLKINMNKYAVYSKDKLYKLIFYL